MSEFTGDLDSREIFPGRWSLLAQWFCIKADATEEEQAAAVMQCRDTLGPDFAECPLEFIADRLYGGFPCGDDPTRVHVMFNAGQYSYTAAEEGRVWECNAASRRDAWKRLLKENKDWKGVGPWVEPEATIYKEGT